MARTHKINVEEAIKYVDRKASEYVAQGFTPGAGVSIASKDKILFSKGYGLSNIEKRTKYTPNTTALLASVSKPISGTLLAWLQRKYRVDVLNTKANIKTSIPYVTKNMTVTDLVTHRSGIPEQYGTLAELLGYSREYIINTLKDAPNRNFRDEHQYTNLPFTQGVQVGVQSVGLTLEQAYRDLFALIGMNESSINYEPNKYLGYVGPQLSGLSKWYPAFKYDVSEQVAAGGIYSSTADMAKFIQFHLQQAALPQEQRLLANEFYAGIYTDKNIVDLTLIYGLGINIRYRIINGKLYQNFEHLGSLPNTVTNVSWIPQLDIGIFVHTNSCPNGLCLALTRSFYLKLTGSTDAEADAEFNQFNTILTDSLIEIFCELTFKVSGDRTIDPNIVGRYHNFEWGIVTIYPDGTIRLGKLPPVHLHKFKQNKYRFVLYDKGRLPYLGICQFKHNKLKLTYQCESRIFIKCTD